MPKLTKPFPADIRKKIIFLVLSTIFVVVTVFTLTTMNEVQNLDSFIAETSEQQRQVTTAKVEEAMDEQLSYNLTTSTTLEAYLAERLFNEAGDTVQLLAVSVQELFTLPERYDKRQVMFPDASLEGTPSVQFVTEAGKDVSDPALAADITTLSGISLTLESLYATSEVDSLYVALPSGIMLIIDNHPSSKLSAEGVPLPLEITQRGWYTAAVESGGLTFSDVPQEAFTNMPAIMCSTPVYVNGNVIAVVGANLSFEDMWANSKTYMGDMSGFSCIINEEGGVVSSTTEGTASELQDASGLIDLKGDPAAIDAFVTKSQETLTEPTIVEIGGNTYHMSGAPIGDTNWIVVNAIDRKVVDDLTNTVSDQFDGIVEAALAKYHLHLRQAATTIAVILLLVSVAALAGVYFLSSFIVKPLELITKRVRSLGGDNLRFEMEDAYRTGDEVEALAEAFSNLSAKTLEYVEEVKRATAERERLNADLSTAANIQASQLPKTFPPFPNRKDCDIFASMNPAKVVGGDFYDFFLVDENRLALIIADVSGKGIPASLFMMVSRSLLKSHLQSGESPAEALRSVNLQLCENNDAGFFVTVWVAVIDLNSGKGIAANAGHEHPALYRAESKFELVVYRHSMSLGVFEMGRFQEHEFEMGPGDTLFVYTDGVPEATDANNELYGSERMLDALNRHPDADPTTLCETVKSDVDRFVGEEEQFDDLTMLSFRYLGPTKDLGANE